MIRKRCEMTSHRFGEKSPPKPRGDRLSLGGGASSPRAHGRLVASVRRERLRVVDLACGEAVGPPRIILRIHALTVIVSPGGRPISVTLDP